MEPPREVRDRVGNRVPGHPVRALDGQLGAGDQLPLHHMPTDVALCHSIFGYEAERAVAVARDGFGVAAGPRPGPCSLVCGSMRNVRLGGSSARTLRLRLRFGRVPAEPSRPAASCRRSRASSAGASTPRDAGERHRGRSGRTWEATEAPSLRLPARRCLTNQATSTSNHSSPRRQPMEKTPFADGSACPPALEAWASGCLASREASWSWSMRCCLWPSQRRYAGRGAGVGTRLYARRVTARSSSSCRSISSPGITAMRHAFAP